MRGFWLLVFTICWWSGLAGAFGRTWTDVKGREIDATFKSYDAETDRVTLTRGGKDFRIPLAELSEADIAFVRDTVAKPKANNAKPANRTEFVRSISDGFMTATFEKGRNGWAKLHKLEAQRTHQEYEGLYYTGFHFTMPEWADGDFKWFFVADKKRERRDFKSDTLKFYILKKDGKMRGFEKYTTKNVAAFPPMKNLYPYTNRFLEQSLELDRFVPGDEYIIWFSYAEEDMTDIDFSLGIEPKRGNSRAGRLLSEIK